MASLTKEKTREVIESFAKEIDERKQIGSIPKTTVINFRSERANNFERPVYEVPLELLRYRKDNGRIASDVMSYEIIHGKLDETQEETQQILRKFLADKDLEKTEILKNAIKKDGQTEPAIITCDGFLINGNRRKMVLEDLRSIDPSKFSTMKVVILPKEGDPGGLPTIREIELLENRYQLQQEGKSEYYGLDRALSIRRKIEAGISLEEQLRDDPSIANLNEKEFRKKINEYKKNYLLPLERVDEYLKQIGREGHYQSVSAGHGDKEGRWQAFIDYSNFYNFNLKEEKWRIKAGISEDDIGAIEDVAFKIIRKRQIPGRNEKLHKIMRDFRKLFANNEARACLLSIVDKVCHTLDEKDYKVKYGYEYDPKQIDSIWGEKCQEVLAANVNAAYTHLERHEERETPLSLVEGAYKKLTNPNLNIDKLSVKELKHFIKITEMVRDRADELRSDAWNQIKSKK